MLELLNFEELNEKELDKAIALRRKKLNFITHFNENLLFLLSMFEYKNTPETLDTRYLELYLHRRGGVVVGKIDEDLYCAPYNLNGEIDAYNLGTNAFGVTPIGRIEGTRGIDIVLGRNNKLMFPSLELEFIADILTELDTSIRNNIRFTRMHNIPIAKDNKQKVLIDEVLNDLENGTLKSVVSENILDGEFDTTNEIRTVSITDVKECDKLQYLFHAKDDVIRQFSTKYGQATQGTGKMAQQTEREIDGSTSLSFVHPLDMLNERKIMVDDINRIFGTNISVDFSKAWKIELEHFEESVDKNDGSEAYNNEFNETTQDTVDEE